MKSIKVCEYSRSRSFHYDLILQDQASGERSQDQWSSGIAKLGCIGVYLFFVFLFQNIDCGYLFEPHQRGSSNMYPKSMFWSKNKKNWYIPAYVSFAI